MEAAAPPPPPPPASQPEPGPAGGRPIEVGRVLGDAFSTYTANFAPLVGISLLISIVFGIVIGFLNDEGGFFLQLIGTILQLVASALFTGFVVKLVQDVRDGRRDSSVGELISAAMPSIGNLIVFSVLSGIAIGIGFFLLIVPGLFLLTIWFVGAPAIVAEGRGALEAFGRSHELVKGNGWQVFGVIVSVFLILIVTGIIAALIGGAIGGVVGAVIVSIVVLALYLPVQALVSAVVFFDLGGGAAAPADRQTVVEY